MKTVINSMQEKKNMMSTKNSSVKTVKRGTRSEKVKPQVSADHLKNAAGPKSLTSKTAPGKTAAKKGKSGPGLLADSKADAKSALIITKTQAQIDAERLGQIHDKFDLTGRTTDELIELNEEEIEIQERQEVLQGMTPSFRQKLEYIEGWLRREAVHYLRRYYELGKQVEELYLDDRQNNGRVYGRDPIGRICKLLHWGDGIIYNSLRLVQTYSEDEIDRLCSVTMPSGAPLSWSHVRCLLEVKEDSKREDVLDLTIKNGWTCNRLAQEVKRIRDPAGSDTRGRPPRTPNHLDDLLAQQNDVIKHWDRLYLRVWSNSRHSMSSQVAKLQPGEVTEQRLGEVK
jgi:hypothetical protein